MLSDDHLFFAFLIAGFVGISLCLALTIPEHRRAMNGLELINKSRLSPELKMQLLFWWRQPRASREQLDWLKHTIESLETKQGGDK